MQSFLKMNNVENSNRTRTAVERFAEALVSSPIVIVTHGRPPSISSALTTA